MLNIQRCTLSEHCASNRDQVAAQSCHVNLQHHLKVSPVYECTAQCLWRPFAFATVLLLAAGLPDGLVALAFLQAYHTILRKATSTATKITMLGDSTRLRQIARTRSQNKPLQAHIQQEQNAKHSTSKHLAQQHSNSSELAAWSFLVNKSDSSLCDKRLEHQKAVHNQR